MITYFKRRTLHSLLIEICDAETISINSRMYRPCIGVIMRFLDDGSLAPADDDAPVDDELLD